MNILQELLEESVRELYYGEQQLVKAIPPMAGNASSVEMKEALMAYLLETQGQIRRLATMIRQLDVDLTGKKSRGMQGLITHGQTAVAENSRRAAVDAAIVGAIQGVGQYEIACYGTAQRMAEALEHQEVARLLQEALNEEVRADQKLARAADEEFFATA
jgi:ferritin-like metal-binding protein YciE